MGEGWGWALDGRERAWAPGCWWTTATVSGAAEEEEEELVSWPLLERAGEEREEDLEGRMRPGLGVLRVRVLESKPADTERKKRRGSVKTTDLSEPHQLF